MFDFTALMGKVAKRQRVATLAEGATCVDTPSDFPYLYLPGGQVIEIKSNNSNAAGDGSGMIKASAAQKWIHASRASAKGDIIALQTVFRGQDFAGKGLFIVVPDEGFPDEQVDLIVDAECFNTNVLSTKFTESKVTPHRHHPNSRVEPLEPLCLMTVASRFIDPQEFAAMSPHLALRDDHQAYQAGSAGQSELEEKLSNEGSTWSDERRPLISNALSRTMDKKADQKLLIAYKTTGSIWASPGLMDRATGGPAKAWQGRTSRSTSPMVGNPRRKTKMPGTMVSGEDVWFMHWAYAQVPEPSEGYLGLIWHRRKEDQIIGACFNDADLNKHRDALDTLDCDDKLRLIFMQDKHGHYYALVLRLPLSVDGGVCLKLKATDARKLQGLGYHLYQKIGTHKVPGLYTIKKDGQPLHPYKLEGKPFENPPRWTTNEEEAVASLLELTKLKGVIGQYANLQAVRDYSGIGDLVADKTNFSETIIDASLHASCDPSPVIEYLEKSVLEWVQAGNPVCPHVFGRVERRIRTLHKESSDQPLQIKLACPPHHQVILDGMATSVKLLNEGLRRRKVKANGPIEWLTTNLDPKLAEIVLGAFEARAAAWSRSARAQNNARDNPNMDQHQKEARKALLLEQIKQEEATLLTDAWASAVLAVPEYQMGQFMALWVQLALSELKRFPKAQGKLQPISTYALDALPVQEHEGYYSRGVTAPSAVVRVLEDTGVEPGVGCQIRQTNSGNLLVTTDGELIAKLGPEGREFERYSMTVLGYMPKIEPEKRPLPVKPIHTYQQTPERRLALQVHL